MRRCVFMSSRDLFQKRRRTRSRIRSGAHPGPFARIWPKAWRKRRYEKAFVSKLCDAEGECAETQVWLEFAAKCGYIDADQARDLYRTYHAILATIVGMITHPDTWTITPETMTLTHWLRQRTPSPSPCHPLTPYHPLMIYPFILAFALALTYALTPLAGRIGVRLGMVDAPGGRRLHEGSIPRTGGLALYAGFTATDTACAGRCRSSCRRRWPSGSRRARIRTRRGGWPRCWSGRSSAWSFGFADDRYDLPSGAAISGPVRRLAHRHRRPDLHQACEQSVWRRTALR